MSDRSLGTRPGVTGPKIYADYAAGAPLRAAARVAIDAAYASGAANASSAHWAGARARAILEDAREEIAAAIGAHPLEIVFTSGATEANNLALLGTAAALDGAARIAVLATDHSSVLEPARALAEAGRDVATVPVDADGLADVDAVARCRPVVLSLALVNAETGAMQDVAPIAEAVRRGGGLIHVDASQAPAVLPVDVAALGADLVTISGHKLGGPPGTGALWVRRGLAVRPVHHGGPQERGLRPGTENVAAIAGFAAACRVAVASASTEAARLGRLTSRLEGALTALHHRARPNGPALAGARRAPHITSVCFAGLRGESLVSALDVDGIAVSAGSACAAGAALPSHVLLAMGRSRDDAESALRVSIGWATTEVEVSRIIAVASEAVARGYGRASGERAARAGAEAWS